MNDCLFCKIVSGDIPSEKVYEDNETLAFLDINPVNPGHTLIIPKEHYESLYETPNEMLFKIITLAKKVAVAIKQSDLADGINLWMNNERAAGQVVNHAHVHVIPRLEGDGHKLWAQQSYSEGEMKKVAEKIQKNIYPA